MKNKISTLLCLTLTLGTASTGFAHLIAYENFDYASSTVANGSGGIGFTNSWDTSGGDALDIVPGLSYPGHLPSGGSAVSVSASASRSGVRSIENASTYT